MLDAAGGEARPGVAMEPSTITMWFSSGKVVTAIAIAQLWEQGRLGLDDRVVEYLPAFTNGKERGDHPPPADAHRGLPVRRRQPAPAAVAGARATDLRRARDVGAGHRGGIPRHIGPRDPRRARAGHRRPSDRAVRRGGGVRATRHHRLLRRDPARRARRVRGPVSRRSAISSRRPGPTCCPASTSSTTTPTSTSARSRPATRAAVRRATWVGCTRRCSVAAPSVTHTCSSRRRSRR